MAQRGTMGSWADNYRQRWRWDRVVWGSHAVDCYPGGCPWYVFVRDGKVVREEQAGTLPQVEPGVPDMNPMGCQKGACWSRLLYAPERVTRPLKRAGERGEGKWQEISWDQALTEIADHILDAMVEEGPESVVWLGTPEIGAIPARVAATYLGHVTTDGNAEFQDMSPGYYLTWGVFNPVSSMDDWFHAQLILIWHANPVYTNIHWYHYIAEARYNGGEVITIAPDFSPSAIHADYHLPVRIGTDAALALAMCKVIIDEGLYDRRFVQEQTDLPLLVRQDTGKFLRASDMVDGGRDDQFYWWDAKAQVPVPAPMTTLALGDIDPALEGTYQVQLKDGTRVMVEPVFQRLRHRLQDYEPERAAQICGIHPRLIRMVARKVASRRTKIFSGWNPGKHYHGDLMERSMALLLALTGNWGKKGTGTRSWAVGGSTAWFLLPLLERADPQEAREVYRRLLEALETVRSFDPTLTREMALVRIQQEMGAADPRTPGRMVPPAFLWYYHYGYKERWNRKEWHDPSMKRTFDEYFQEALEKGWWDNAWGRVWQEVRPRVLMEAGGNVLRRQRGGQELLLKHLWPKLRCIVSIDFRITTTGLYSDYILPAAQHYEKIGFSMPSIHHLNTVLCDRAVPPPDEAKTDWEIGILLLEKVEQRARERGIKEVRNRAGQVISLEGLVERATLGGAIRDEEARMDFILRCDAALGILPQGTDLQKLRQVGHMRWQRLTLLGHGPNQASQVQPNETFNPFRWHVEDKMPYATLTRRAQFYIDHDWFLEAGEELPCHKEVPPMGGNYPFRLTSGHNRWSIHSMNQTNKIILNTHRGEPFVFINDQDAAAKGIKNGDYVRLFNDCGSMVIQAKVSPAVRPGQLILYNGWEPYTHRGWFSESDLEPGMVKWLHLAGGYGHLRYRIMHWQPIPVDRAITVDVEKAS
jgi:DMSO reductase family type II enzyme molybdopterin subunit